ncbi:hypothetical protein M011DRAFT_409825 [Sporormia fimetaria CBS 119925]|uniref:F-box domain-containing protein n=1 Tax=Sporormia fimetaria CBS 119925 TaxID=1340428 RepID=A0A6A6V340_9PLEO|nr:hypothetical protein M011DRAFT_409825 [Sporormia fimetaria CBS 119925]
MPLDVLPTELVQTIARNLDLDSSRSLRLSCSTVNQQTLYPFRERFFRQCTLLWDLQRFQILAEIVEHPYFGDALEHLLIDATPYDAIKLWQIQKHLDDLNPSPINPYKNWADVDVYGEVKRLTVEQRTITKHADFSAKFWNETQTDLTMLITIFQRLQNQLRTITFAYEGMDKEFSKFARKYCESSQREMSRPFVTMMAAIARSGVTVESITTSRTAPYGAVCIGRFETLSRYLTNFGTAFEHLRTLKLNLRDWRYPEEGFEPPPGKIPFIVRFLAKCKAVEDLELSCYSSLEGDLILRDLAKHCALPHLRSCRLELFRIVSIDDLFTFLAPSRHLKRLVLRHVVLRDDTATWGDVMRRLATEHDLDGAELRSLFNRSGARVGIEGSVMGAIVVTAPDFKRKMLETAEMLVGGNWGPIWLLASVAYPFIGMRI